MSDKRILITENDLRRLQPLVEAARSGESEDKRNADRLEKKLTLARVSGSRQIPENVVTMNSWILLLRLDSSEKTECWLRFPAEGGSSSRVVSILTDLGIALLGSREGDVIEWSGPAGKGKAELSRSCISRRGWATPSYDLVASPENGG
jgi:regulator of nucleoside diphosphate kinase